ncbi:MAG: LCP family protein, partial [Cyanobacteria bacterium J06598_4]
MNKGKAILVGLGLASVSLVSAVVGAFLAVAVSDVPPLKQVELSSEEQKVFSKADMVTAKNLNLPELKRPVNILFLGIKVISSDLEGKGIEYEKQDVGYHHLVNSFDGLSDSMLLLRFDPEAEKVSVLSIPRDTRVYIEGYGVRKINHANDYGGPALTASVASELLGGIKIDRYVRVNVQGVEKLIDALGGVTVNVPKDMKYNDFSQHLYIDLKKGIQHLDGDKAMQFLRYRYDGLGDISRVQRQQMLMRAAVEQTLKPATVIKVPKILSVIQSHLDTNLTVRELMALSNFASKTDRSGIKMMMLPGDFNNGDERVSYWLPNHRKINRLMTQHFAMPRDGSDYEVSGNRYATL